MYYIVGLGNPGERYQRTRHNIGWLALDAFIAGNGLPRPVQSAQYGGRMGEGYCHGEEVVVLYPDTFMNNSGSVVKKLVPASVTDRLIVLHDDVDLPLGQVRVSFGRGSGGHNGVVSIIDKLGTRDFIRVRIGVAKSGFWPWQQDQVIRPQGGGALEKFVLGGFSTREETTLQAAIQAAAATVTMIIEKGKTAAMNEFN